MSEKNEVFKNFINDDLIFNEACQYWNDLVDKMVRDYCIEKEMDQLNAFDRDANPILYKCYHSINKSIRIIQEESENNSIVQLGAWVEKPDEFRHNYELVISVELTEETKSVTEKMIKKWFQCEYPSNFEEELKEILK